MDFVCIHYGNKLGNSSKQQISMESFFILRPTSCNTKTVFEVVDSFFNIYPYFIGTVQFFCTADCSGVSEEILFRINVNHSSAGGRCAGAAAVADTFGFLCCFVVLPFHFGTDKLHGWNSTS